MRLTGWLRAARVGPLQGAGLWGSVGVILAFLAISVPQYGQPYVIDEAVFPYVADGILKNGAPYFYNGEFRPQDLGLWHPPLYDYLLAGHLWIWGVSSFAVRAFGALCVIASFFFLTLTLRRIAPDLKQYGYVALAALFLLNPLVISGALVPDIDGTLGLLVTTMALWVATLVVQKAVTWRLLLGLFGFAILAVSTKFTIAGIVAVILGVAALIAPEQRWRKVIWVVIAFAAGTAVSLGLLFALGGILQFDARGPFEYMFGSLGSRPPGRGGVSAIYASLTGGPGGNLVWIGPAIIFSAIAAFVAVLIVKPAKVSRRLAALVLGSSLAILLGYSYISGPPFGFPKYTPITVGGFALVAVLALTLLPARVAAGGQTRSTAQKWVLSIAYGVVLVGATVATFVIAARWEAVHPRSLPYLLVLTAVEFIGVALATAVFSLLLVPNAAGRGIRRLIRPATVGVIISLVVAPIIVQTTASLVNATAPYATRYYFGERGLDAFLSQAGEVIPPGAFVIAAKDIGLQLDRPFYEDAFLLPLPPDELRDKLERLQAPYLITRDLHDYSEAAYPEQFDVLREFYVPVLSSPDYDFVLWELKPSS